MLLLFISLAQVVGIFASQDEPPIWDVQAKCDIPNEAEPGFCTSPQACDAFQNIIDGASPGRVGFIKALECNSANETSVCCPRNGANYTFPEITENFTSKIRLGNRFIDNSCGYQAYEGLIKGVMTSIDEYPWAALLFYKNGYQGCGGVLISSKFVLTAAHCVAGSAYRQHGPLTNIRLREYNLESDPDCVIVKEAGKYYEDCSPNKLDRKPRSIIVHPLYEPDSFNQFHDIALVEIDPVGEYDDFIRPICLPEGNELGRLTAGSDLNVCGWGRTDFFSEGSSTTRKSPIKMKAHLPLVDQRTCEYLYRAQKISLISGQICAGGRIGQDSCAGDSGSPLMLYNVQTGRWILAGIVSRGSSTCGLEDRPGIYTYVKEYMPWILQNIRKR
ncbi:CLIP domain-containing serine protease B8-like [Uranotaenia lowii]|uniref:CLIP domain-containing serine protease B8-like n=1 Tax=Uranotaenia lowii TaxID=190385 RepID=UPI0024797BD3|nr:CLIP domain-containing serine protease B8-like [Uranotaenia lowii]